MSQSTAVLNDDDECLAHLECELQASHANEETSKQALRQLHQKLNEAYLTIVYQQQRIKLLTEKLKSRRSLTEAELQSNAPSFAPRQTLSFPDAADTAPSGFLDITHPDNFYRKLVQGMSIENNVSQILLCPIREGKAAERIESLWERLPSWTQGTILGEDAAFLGALIEEVRPDQVYEIGVASGSSSALILSSMATYGNPSRIWLHSYDISDICYFDKTHAIGDAAREMVPELLEHWKLNAQTTALDVPRQKEPQTRSLYFIDANHSQPWPALDLIALLQGLKSGDHVVFHDINLPKKFDGKFPEYGAQCVFEDWMGVRLAPDVPIPNIGAIIIPEDKRLIVSSLVKTLSRPWPDQLTAEKAHLRACEQSLLEFLRENKLV